MKINILLIFLCLSEISAVTHAETTVAPSLEWMADHCVDSGIYTVIGIRKVKEGNLLELDLQLKRGLRGNPKKEIKQQYYKLRLSDEKKPLVEIDNEFLICFQHYNTGEKRVIQTINLDNPQLAGFSLIAVSCDLKLLKNKKEILEVFETRLKSHSTAEPVEISDYSKDNRIDMGPNAEIYSAIYSGSACYLRIPDDMVEAVKTKLNLELEKSLKQYSKNTTSQILPLEVNPVSPYPGGSPFPPGGAPNLTHTATCYWTTLDGFITDIHINATGEHPTQFAFWKWTNDKKEYIANSISPNCQYNIRISSTKSDSAENINNLVANGNGGIEVRVYGFKQEDFNSPPIVSVSYSKEGKVIGETKVIPYLSSEKIK
jgi:hypothetical protein